MDWKVISVLFISWAVSLILAVKAIRSNRSLLDKLAGIALLIVPVLGPVFYWFVYDDTPPQRPDLQVRGARGAFSDGWIARRQILEDGLRRFEKLHGHAHGDDDDSAKPS